MGNEARYCLLSSLDVLRNFHLVFETSSTTCVVTGLICSLARAFSQVHPRNGVHSGFLLLQFFVEKTWSASRNNSFVRSNASKAVRNNFFVRRKGDSHRRGWNGISMVVANEILKTWRVYSSVFYFRCRWRELGQFVREFVLNVLFV